MGFDLIAKSSSLKPEEYFRNNCFWWRPLWQFVREHCSDVVTEEDFEGGQTNNGYFISKEKAERIAIRLEHLIYQGMLKQYERDRGEYLESLPDEMCDICYGAGVRRDENIKCKKDYVEVKPCEHDLFSNCMACNYAIRTGEYKSSECNQCYGTGKTRPFECHYPFDEGNVKKFIRFCRKSEGFWIE